jgi:hypothetical protein
VSLTTGHFVDELLALREATQHLALTVTEPAISTRLTEIAAQLLRLFNTDGRDLQQLAPIPDLGGRTLALTAS